MNVSIIGATGYGGLELIRFLKQHPHFRIAGLHTSSKSGRPLGEEYPHLMHGNYTLNEIDPEKIAKNSKIVFIAAPSGVSWRITSAFQELGVKVIDLSGDLRLKNSEEYRRWYQHEPASEQLLKKAVYGLAEWNNEAIKEAELIANPGCYPTASLLGLAPLVTEGMASGEDLIIDAKSGVSGAGKQPSDTAHFSTMNENFKVYKVHRHQHIPEIEQQLGNWCDGVKPISFTTHLVPMTRGIMATMYIKLKKPARTEELVALYRTVYENSPFIRVQPSDRFPSTKQVYGSNYCDIGIAYDERTQKATIISVIDNLVKGAAGQAVQNANILMGFEETAGLTALPLFP